MRNLELLFDLSGVCRRGCKSRAFFCDALVNDVPLCGLCSPSQMLSRSKHVNSSRWKCYNFS
jgi:hypothetical protein